jgi:chromosome segregation ATPase
LSDSGPETPKPDQTVGQSELDKDLDNLRVQNEALRADNERLQKELAKAAEDYQTQVIISQQFNKQALDVRSQLATAQATIGTIENELETAKGQLAERDAELAEVQADRDELRSQLATVQAEKKALQKDLAISTREYIRGIQESGRLKQELAQLKKEAKEAAEQEQNPAPAIKLPSPADLLNQLKSKRKKSTASLADVEKILEIIEGDGNE